MSMDVIRIATVGAVGTTLAASAADRTRPLPPPSDALAASPDESRRAGVARTTVDPSVAVRAVAASEQPAPARRQPTRTRNGPDPSLAATVGTDPIDEFTEDVTSGRPHRVGQRFDGADGDADDAPTPGTPKAAMAAVSSSLRMEPDTVVSALKGGATIVDLAAQQGVDPGPALRSVRPGMVFHAYA